MKDIDRATIDYLIFHFLPFKICLAKFVLKLLLLLKDATNLRITFLHLHTNQIKLRFSLFMNIFCGSNLQMTNMYYELLTQKNWSNKYDCYLGCLNFYI